jgi:hypothetical protein
MLRQLGAGWPKDGALSSLFSGELTESSRLGYFRLAVVSGRRFLFFVRVQAHWG